ncbi:MAG: pyrroline-5-carboxylate reductase [Candidatus Fischerbacteria bacterium RBG_13_37_8]|uniref:Pyrroline-5-carboxylate reductase n=1 Tax=Candidatus Fischerbacteria bacterium RBG_13_37_8 TaxID=1817863 RepID=A0A1F5VJX9_9BACT|nr:MAG: pyrroline-5-carboxylate reductase [Candidatus Fischerbacteria bacterium RBG_13_37_8]
MKYNLCFIGIGNMGGSLVDIFLHKNLWERKQLLLCDCDERKLLKYANGDSVKLFTDATEAVRQSRTFVIAVKPQDSDALFRKIRMVLHPDSLIISTMAGVSINTICSSTGCNAVIRTMPNLPVMLGKGMIGWACSAAISQKMKIRFRSKIRYIGKELYFPEEETLDKITALSGSGPMYIAFIALSLMEAGIKLGLPEQEARIIAIQTLLGSSMMLAQLAIHPETFIAQITSKGGTTEQAMKIFQHHDLKNIITEAVEAAFARAQTLSSHK